MLRVAALRKLTFMLAAMGVIVGVIDVMSVAVATRQGVPAGASIVLSVYALGSCLAGLAFGAMRLSMPLPRMLAIAGAMTAATTLPLLWVDDLLGLSLAVLAAGVSFAPTMIIAMGMAEAAAPASPDRKPDLADHRPVRRRGGGRRAGGLAGGYAWHPRGFRRRGRRGRGGAGHRAVRRLAWA